MPKDNFINVSIKKHPHACGEDSLVAAINDKTEETPPRMWGRLENQQELKAVGRNTPTHVGKTFFVVHEFPLFHLNKKKSRLRLL